MEEAAARALALLQASMAERAPLRPRPRSGGSSGSTAAGRRRGRPAKGEPLHPWTIPNLVGYLRLAAIPVFLYLAFESGDGRSAGAGDLFWLIAAGDYVDGFLARVTGQYSRLGALLDPFVDRLTILSGAVVCWHFELLPRWALALLVAREVVMLVLAQYGAAPRGRDRGQLAGADLGLPDHGRDLLRPGLRRLGPGGAADRRLALAILATVLYARTGLRAVRERGAQDERLSLHKPST